MATAAAVAPLASSGISPRGSITWLNGPSAPSCPSSYPALSKPKPMCTARTSSADVAAAAAYACLVNGIFGGKSDRSWDGRPVQQRTRVLDRTMSRLLLSGAEPLLPVGIHNVRCVLCFAGRMGFVEEDRGGDNDDRDTDDDEVGEAPVPAVGVETEIVSVTELRDGSIVFEFARAKDSKTGVFEESGPLSPPEELQEVQHGTDENHAISECKNEETLPHTTLEMTGAVETQVLSATSELWDVTSPTLSSPPHGAGQQLSTDALDGEFGRRSAAVGEDDQRDHVEASAVSNAGGGGESGGLLERDEGETTGSEAHEDTQVQLDRLPRRQSSSSFHKPSPIPVRQRRVRIPSNVMIVGNGHAEGSEKSAEKMDVACEEHLLSLTCRPPSRFIKMSPVRVWKTLRRPANIRQESALKLENSGEVSVEGFLSEDRNHHTPMAQRPPSSFRKVSPIPAQSALRNAAQVSREEGGPAAHNTTQTEGLGAIRGTALSTEEIVRVQLEENTDTASPLSPSGAAFHAIGETTRQDGAASALQSFSVASEEQADGDRTPTTSPSLQLDSPSKMQRGPKRGRLPHVGKEGSLQSGAVVPTTGDKGQDEEDSPVDLVLDLKHVMPFSEDSEYTSDSRTDAQADMALKHAVETDAGVGGATVEDVHAPKNELAASSSPTARSSSSRERTRVKRGGRVRKKTKEDMVGEEMEALSNQLRQDVQEIEAEPAMISVARKSGTTRKKRARRKEGREGEEEEEEEEEEDDAVAQSEELELETNVGLMQKANILNGNAEEVALESSYRRRKAEGRKKAGRRGKAGKNVGVNASGASSMQGSDDDDDDGNEVPSSPPQVELNGINAHVGDLATQTLSELKGLARELGVKGFSTMRKGKLVDALTTFLTSSSAEKS